MNLHSYTVRKVIKEWRSVRKGKKPRRLYHRQPNRALRVFFIVYKLNWFESVNASPASAFWVAVKLI